MCISLHEESAHPPLNMSRSWFVFSLTQSLSFGLAKESLLQVPWQVNHQDTSTPPCFIQHFVDEMRVENNRITFYRPVLESTMLAALLVSILLRGSR